MIYLFIIVGVMFFLLGIYYAYFDSKKNKVETVLSSDKKNISIETIKGISYEQNNVEEYKINEEIEVEKVFVESEYYEFSVEDEEEEDDDLQEDEISKEDLIPLVNDVVEKIKDEDVDVFNENQITDAENMIFGNNLKENSFEKIEKIIADKVDNFIINVSNENKDIRNFIKLPNGDNYLVEYEKYLNINNN